MSLFDILGVVVGIYAVYAGIAGAVVARSGPGARIVSRDESPLYFWTVVVIYLGLAAALIVVF